MRSPLLLACLLVGCAQGSDPRSGEPADAGPDAGPDAGDTGSEGEVGGGHAEGRGGTGGTECPARGGPAECPNEGEGEGGPAEGEGEGGPAEGEGEGGPAEGEGEGGCRPSEELCNGLDDDCDGAVDNGLPEPPCQDEAGVCDGSVRRCAGADGFVACDAAIYQAHDGRYAVEEGPEHCDGADNDCDGLTDEGGPGPRCALQEGVCAGATKTCEGARGWADCGADRYLARHPLYVAREGAANCEGLDNDCDGLTDEECECQPGDTRRCGRDQGECRTGTQECVAGMYGECDGAEPEPEECDGLDNDCDGAVDEGASCGEDRVCVDGGCQRTRWRFEAESGANGHDVGRREAEGWSASTGPDRSGYLVFGPYTREIPAGTFDAVFRLMVDNNVADGGTVARIEVNDFDRTPECGDCLLARRNVGRREFQGAFRYQDVVLRFRGPGANHRLELRTYWSDIAYVRQDWVEVRRVAP